MDRLTDGFRIIEIMLKMDLFLTFSSFVAFVSKFFFHRVVKDADCLVKG